jgi:hypothetical protein
MNIMAFHCKNCKRKIQGLLDHFNCRYCHENHCSNCRLPEDHNCKEAYNPYSEKKGILSTNYSKLYFPDTSKIAMEMPRVAGVSKGKPPFVFPATLFYIFVIIIGVGLSLMYMVNYTHIFNIPASSIPNVLEWQPRYIDNSNGILATISEPTTIAEVYATGLHWKHLPITYSISDCNTYEESRIVKAFATIENETDNAINFEQSTNANIQVDCTMFKSSYDSVLSMLETKGLTTISFVGNIITDAKIEFFSISPTDSSSFTGGCSTYMDLEIHEILHALGEVHNDSRDSIMFPIRYRCAWKIDDYVIQNLKNTYG